MGMARSAGPVLRAALLAVSAGFLFTVPLASGAPPGPRLQVIAPGNGAVLPPGKILVIGTAKEEGISRVEVDLNGKGSRSVGVTGGGFSVEIPLPPGKNVLRVAAGKSSVSIAVTGDPKGGYRYHEDAGRCASCHDRPGTGYAVRAPKDALCYRCHDRQDAGRNIHGPLGGGECTACHDPHGSMNAGLVLKRPDELCGGCHDQESSTKHMKDSRGRRCTGCHDPHSSDKAFLRR